MLNNCDVKKSIAMYIILNPRPRGHMWRWAHDRKTEITYLVQQTHYVCAYMV